MSSAEHCGLAFFPKEARKEVRTEEPTCGGLEPSRLLESPGCKAERCFWCLGRLFGSIGCLYAFEPGKLLNRLNAPVQVPLGLSSPLCSAREQTV